MPPRPTTRVPAFVSRSETLKTDYWVYVDTSHGASISGQVPLPVVVVVDGDYMFDPLVDAAKDLGPKISPTLLVGIGYGKPFGSPGNRRGRDYTTSAGVEEPGSGGAQQFYEYLIGPLWHELAERYPVASDKRVIAGHSLGGLFALHALFQVKPFFHAAIAGAPSVWWDNHRYLSQLAEFQKKHPTLNARLFLGIGENDSVSMLSDLARLEKLLVVENRFDGLKVLSKKFSDHDHYDVLPTLFDAGLKALLR